MDLLLCPMPFSGRVSIADRLRLSFGWLHRADVLGKGASRALRCVGKCSSCWRQPRSPTSMGTYAFVPHRRRASSHRRISVIKPVMSPFPPPGSSTSSTLPVLPTRFKVLTGTHYLRLNLLKHPPRPRNTLSLSYGLSYQTSPCAVRLKPISGPPSSSHRYRASYSKPVLQVQCPPPVPRHSAAPSILYNQRRPRFALVPSSPPRRKCLHIWRLQVGVITL